VIRRVGYSFFLLVSTEICEKLFKTSVSDPHGFSADPDPAF
jgi:hypothetical protein